MEASLTDKGAPLSSSSDIYVILSLSAWTMLLITSWMPILTLGASKNEIIYYLWIFMKTKYQNKSGGLPLDINFAVFNVIFILTFILGTIAFMVYIFCMFIKNNTVITGMIGNISKFHFIPLFLISGLFIIGESYDNREYDYTFNDAKYIFSIIFTVLALITLIFISFRTQIESPWYASLTINKGFYSCLIALLIYNFGYLFTYYGRYRKLKDLRKISYDDYYKKLKEYNDWNKGCYLAFTIVIGILSNAVAFLLKDLVVSLMNILIYLGMMINYFRLTKEARKALYKHEIIGIFEIIMIVISVAYIVFHIIRYRGIVPNQF